MTPWEVLGLPETVTDAAVVRRAYAAALRAHRPDSDPEGFRRVRGAYESILEMLDGVSDGTEPSWAGPPTAEPSFAPDPSRRDGQGVDAELPLARSDSHPSPSTLRAAHDEWVARLTSATADAPAARGGNGARRALASLAREAQTSPEATQAFRLALATVLRDAPHPALDALVTPAQWVELVGSGESNLAGAVLARWTETSDWQRLGEAARAAVAARVAPPDPDAAVLGIQLCFALAIADLRDASALADHLYAVLPVGARSALSDSGLEERLVVGREVAGWPLAARRRLAEIVLRGTWEAAERRPRGSFGLRRGLARVPSDSVTAALVRRDFPALGRWSRIASKARTDARPRPSTARLGWYLVIGIFVATRLISLLSDSPSKRARLRPPSDVNALPRVEPMDVWTRRRPGESPDEHRRRMMEAARRIASGESVDAVLRSMPRAAPGPPSDGPPR